MPRKKESARAASGTGTLRKKTVTRNGKEYPYWEARYTVGFDPGTGKQIQRSITGKTQVGGQRACVHHRNGAAPGPAHHPAGIQAHCGLYRLSRGPLPRPAALLRRGFHPFWGRYQDGARQSRPCHRRLYPGRIRARHRPNETGERPPYGELHQRRFGPIRENIREKTIEKARYPLRDNGFRWSCYPDLNWGPHPYQYVKTNFMGYPFVS